jgi:signal transduction histidine kinase
MLVIISILIILINITAVAYFIYQLKHLGYSIGLQVNHPYFVFISKQSMRLYAIFAISSILIFITLIIFALYYSHRIVGPIYQLKKYLIKIANGEDGAELSFREKDFFPELPAHVNAAVRKLKKE